jgi:hypothetical protein
MKTILSLLSTLALCGSMSGLVQVQPGTSGSPNPAKNAPPTSPKGEQPQMPTGHPQIPMPKVDDEWPKALAEDVSSVEAIVKAFYTVPAGPAGQARDWNRYRSLFVPSARMIPARSGPGGTAGTYFLSIGEYVDANKAYFEKGGFFDREVSRRTESFGNIVHVWSTFESRRKADDAMPYIRGINSIQLLKDGDRYWIVNVYWDFERPDQPLPERYLTAKTEPAP